MVQPLPNSEESETNNWYGYYERLSTQTGNYDLNSSSNGFVANSSNTGWYQWVGLSYYDNKNLGASTFHLYMANLILQM